MNIITIYSNTRNSEGSNMVWNGEQRDFQIIDLEIEKDISGHTYTTISTIDKERFINIFDNIYFEFWNEKYVGRIIEVENKGGSIVELKINLDFNFPDTPVFKMGEYYETKNTTMNKRAGNVDLLYRGPVEKYVSQNDCLNSQSELWRWMQQIWYLQKEVKITKNVAGRDIIELIYKDVPTPVFKLREDDPNISNVSINLESPEFNTVCILGKNWQHELYFRMFNGEVQQVNAPLYDTIIKKELIKSESFETPLLMEEARSYLIGQEYNNEITFTVNKSSNLSIIQEYGINILGLLVEFTDIFGNKFNSKVSYLKYGNKSDNIEVKLGLSRKLFSQRIRKDVR